MLKPRINPLSISSFLVEVYFICAYIEGYGERYNSKVINNINKLRNQICQKLQTASEADKIVLKNLLNELDNNQEINRKKGV